MLVSTKERLVCISAQLFLAPDLTTKIDFGRLTWTNLADALTLSLAAPTLPKAALGALSILSAPTT